MYELIYTGQFKKSLKKCAKRGLNIQALVEVLNILQEKGELPPIYQPHKLSSDYSDRGSEVGGRRSIDPPSPIFDPPSSDTGTHADLF